MKFSLEPFSKGSRSLEAEPQVARRSERNPLLIFAPGENQPKIETKRDAHVAQFLRAKRAHKNRSIGNGFFILHLTAQVCASKDALFWYIQVETRAQRRVSKGAFRRLRSAARSHLDGLKGLVP